MRQRRAVAVGGAVDTSTPMGEAMANVLVTFAHEDGRKLLALGRGRASFARPRDGLDGLLTDRASPPGRCRARRAPSSRPQQDDGPCLLGALEC
jgi:hypothetical protein